MSSCRRCRRRISKTERVWFDTKYPMRVSDDIVLRVGVCLEHDAKVAGKARRFPFRVPVEAVGRAREGVCVCMYVYKREEEKE